jgi:hypothetical protein
LFRYIKSKLIADAALIAPVAGSPGYVETVIINSYKIANYLSVILKLQQKYPEAETLAKEALAGLRKLGREREGMTQYILYVQKNLADILVRQLKYAEAEVHARAVYECEGQEGRGGPERIEDLKTGKTAMAPSPGDTSEPAWVPELLLLAECMIMAGREAGYVDAMIRKSKQQAETMLRDVLAMSPTRPGAAGGQSSGSSSERTYVVPDIIVPLFMNTVGLALMAQGRGATGDAACAKAVAHARERLSPRDAKVCKQWLENSAYLMRVGLKSAPFELRRR